MLVLFNKPFNVLCQFTDRGTPPRRTLAEFGLPAKVYPAGRLDLDSEGLLLLTDDGALAHRMTDPHHKQPKTYLAQVEGAPDDAALQRLRDGVMLNDGPALPARARLLTRTPGWLWPRDPPVRLLKTVPDAWIELTLRDCDTLGLMLQCCVLRMPTEICVLYVLQSTQQSALELRTGSSAARLSGLDAGTDRATIEDRQRHPGPK